MKNNLSKIGLRDVDRQCERETKHSEKNECRLLQM
jgi:hypothetical protein